MNENNETRSIQIEYNCEQLYNYFKTLELGYLEDQDAQYIDVLKTDLQISFDGRSITHLKKYLKNNNYKTDSTASTRTDLVAVADSSVTVIKDILDQIHNRGLSTGLVTFFLQKKGNDVPVHVDYPYRKNSLVMIPIIFNEFIQSDAITWYPNGGEYQVTKPIIMNVMKLHGVRNINTDRLMLHIEIPDTPISEIYNE
jgi:hypothetical protein